MEKQEYIKRYSAEPADKILLANVIDRIDIAQRKNIPQHTRFLDERQQELIRRICEDMGADYLFYGGYEGAERKILLLPPSYMTHDQMKREDISLLRVCCPRAESKLTHRDFLGSLMGMGIVRESVGDILVGENSGDIVVLKEIKDFLLFELKSIGRAAATVSEIEPEDIEVPESKVRVIKDTVPSMRLDCIVGAGFSVSRDKASELIRSGRVRLQAVECTKPDKTVPEGAVISARGFGKIELTCISGMTKKGRISIEILRYL